jgi:hypothetical protein
MNRIQIGVVGSAVDLNYNKELEKTAERIGELIAQSGNILLYGAEKDYDSLGTAAARGAKSFNGLTIGVTYNVGKEIYDIKNTDVIIASGLERGGGREFVLINSCDVVIAIGGGSGTLTELAMAYQLNIPMIVMKNSGGWSDQLAGSYFDERKRKKVLVASTPEKAVILAIKIVTQEYLNKKSVGKVNKLGKPK